MYYRCIIFVSILLGGTASGMETNENNAQSHFETLPDGLIAHIGDYLEPGNLYCFVQVNRKTREIVRLQPSQREIVRRWIRSQNAQTKAATPPSGRLVRGGHSSDFW